MEGQEQFSQDQDNASSYKTLEAVIKHKNSSPCLIRERNNSAEGKCYSTYSF